MNIQVVNPAEALSSSVSVSENLAHVVNDMKLQFNSVIRHRFKHILRTRSNPSILPEKSTYTVTLRCEAPGIELTHTQREALAVFLAMELNERGWEIDSFVVVEDTIRVTVRGR